MEMYVLNFGEDYILTIITILIQHLVKVKLNRQLLYHSGERK